MLRRLLSHPQHAPHPSFLSCASSALTVCTKGGWLWNNYLPGQGWQRPRASVSCVFSGLSCPCKSSCFKDPFFLSVTNRHSKVRLWNWTLFLTLTSYGWSWKSYLPLFASVSSEANVKNSKSWHIRLWGRNTFTHVRSWHVGRVSNWQPLLNLCSLLQVVSSPLIVFVILLESTHSPSCLPQTEQESHLLSHYLCQQCDAWHTGTQWLKWQLKGTTYSNKESTCPTLCYSWMQKTMQRNAAPVTSVQRSIIHPSSVWSSPGIVNLSKFICFKSFQIRSLLLTNVSLLTA